MACEIISSPRGMKFTAEQRQRFIEIFELYFEMEYVTRKAEMDPMIALLDAEDAAEAEAAQQEADK